MATEMGTTPYKFGRLVRAIPLKHSQPGRAGPMPAIWDADVSKTAREPWENM